MTTQSAPTHPAPVPRGHERVDGNALAGILSDLFTGDPTTMVGECGPCGAEAVLADAVVELDPAGAIVICRSCTHTLFTVLAAPDGVHWEIAGLRSVRYPAP